MWEIVCDSLFTLFGRGEIWEKYRGEKKTSTHRYW
jgi:hypothetical protein